MNTSFKVDREELGCSQPYIDNSKYQKLKICDLIIEPLPVMIYQGRYYLTDGHTRALLSPEKYIEVYLDDDIVGKEEEAYIVYINWTLEKGVSKIDDLAMSIVEAEDFERLWIEPCQKLDISLKKEE